jgi:hypothetical protein
VTRFKLFMLRNLEEAHRESFVRELEMEVDGCIPEPGARVQFWKDVELYGIDEAILYVKNGKRGRWMSILAKWLDVANRAVPPDLRPGIDTYWESKLGHVPGRESHEVILDAITRWWVAYRDPGEHMNRNWKLQGSSELEPYRTYDDAKAAAVKLANESYVNVMVVGAPFRLSQ